MTALEVVDMISILTDDSQAWFPMEDGRDYAFLFNLIDQAQLKTIEKYYTMQDERALRTLYSSVRVQSGMPIPRNPLPIGFQAGVLYPRALILEDVYTVNQTSTINLYNASYENYDTYQNLTRTKSRVYTLKNTMIVGRLVKEIHFNSSDWGTLYYIREPEPFFLDNSRQVTLELPIEYHFEVCCLTAEMMNNLDKYETERSAAMSRDSALTFEGLGLS